MKKLSMRELARVCGLSITTVSQALSGRGRVATATAERVCARARALGYTINPHASALARLGYAPDAGVPVAVLRAPRRGLDSPGGYLVSAFRRQGPGRGFHVSVNLVATAGDWPRVARVLLHRGVRGVFLPPIDELAHVPAEVFAPFSVVAVGRHHGLPAHCSVHHEIFDSTRWALREMVARGYRRILPLLSPHAPEIEDDEERWAAVKAERRLQRGRGPVLPPVMKTRDRLDPTEEVRRARADAVLCFNDVELLALRAGGVRVPEELGVVVLHSKNPALSGWGPVGETVAGACLDLMTNLLRQRERGAPALVQHLRVAREWREGATLRPRSSTVEVAAEGKTQGSSNTCP